MGYLEIHRLNNGIEYIVQYELCDEQNTPFDPGCDDPNTSDVTAPTHIRIEVKDIEQSSELNTPKGRPNEFCALYERNPQGWLAKVERDVRNRGYVTETENQQLQDLMDMVEGDGLEGRAIQGQIERIWWLAHDLS